MDVFKFREELVEEYERFARSFAKIRAEDISKFTDEQYGGGHFWPDPMIQLNPKFEAGGRVDDLVNEGILDVECAKIFRKKSADDTVGKSLLLHQHQTESIDIAKRGESYVLTTGTGSGKSLCYFVPIVDDVLQRKRANNAPSGITAIVVYPMNALCNSQCEELAKYLKMGYPDGKEPVTFARYTGQETQDEREQIAKNPPDILLTNYMMLELLMTRFKAPDPAIRKHADGLRFLVLDELHTYRGRQGADVAMLVRRVRERFNDKLQCIGTSATMASEGSSGDRDVAVANVASRLFGTNVDKANIVSETLKPVTNFEAQITKDDLRTAIESGLPSNLSHKELSKHPVATWVEQNLGLERQGDKLIRVRHPLKVLDASERLAKHSGVDKEQCRSYLADFLLLAHRSQNEEGHSFFAFRLHQFISGAWNAYSTLEAPNKRHLTLQGQQFKPGDRERPLYSLCFCRACGQEYWPVWANRQDREPKSFTPRDLTERSRGDGDEDIQFGYLMPDTSQMFDADDIEGEYPEEWLEFKGDEARLKYNFRQYRPLGVNVSTIGDVTSGGLFTWFIPGPFRFCLNPECDAQFDGNVRSELTKLSGLSSEGRSSSTTVLALSALKYLTGTDLDEKTKKLLAFTDNRQDASLQAGHFNDFVQILLLRGALLAAIDSNSEKRLTDDILTQQVFDHLHLNAHDYAANPEAKGIKAENTRKALRDVIGYRLYFDLMRGWRITNPNLEQLGLLEVGYQGLMQCCEDEEEWQKCHPLLGSIAPGERHKIVRELLDRMRRALCIKTIYMDANFQEQMRNRSFNELKEPWGLSEDEKLFSHALMVPRTRGSSRQKGDRIFNISHRSVFGRSLKRKSLWGQDNPSYPGKFDEGTYNTIIDGILKVLTAYGYVEPCEIDKQRVGYRIDSSVLEWRFADGSNSKQGNANAFFRNLYQNVAALLNSDDRLLHQLEAREHTAQVDTSAREEREERFRKGLEPGGLPILFCSPTMELGVDISTLNTVYMRNVPPTPANYAQRSGRAGRSGQPALVVTYCAAKSPHDQYFFDNPERMVAGVVNPPSIELANEDLIRSHLHAIWLAETGIELDPSISNVLDRNEPDELPLLGDVLQQIGTSSAVTRARGRSEHIIETIQSDLEGQSAPWFTDNWLESAMNSAERRFDESFKRWRSLYRATSSQMEAADKIVNSASASERERKEAKARYVEAFTQRELLLDSNSTANSDFNTYRYLAAEGFLPGYNFPRLPLMAFIPGRRENLVRDKFLSRPRFLGLGEFGPRSIIYHEGSTYRVQRAILLLRDESEVSTSGRLPVQVARICPSCGYGHFGDQREFERCVSCNDRLDGGKAIDNLYRIEQVSTRRANRINSDEEERQRQGYEMITTLRFSEENNRQRVDAFNVEESGETLAELQYGPAATLWRVNLGWRRRQEETIYGFSVDANTGEWTKDSQAPTDDEDDQLREGGSTQRITPFVEDTRNVLLFRPMVELPDEGIISLQYALKRGIEQEFQLESAELAAEPLPDRNNRTTILFYESAEGGAGVLTRLGDASTLAKVARRALEICHWGSKSGNWAGFDDLKNLSSDERDGCEAGCYRCLLSYYNQPDHTQIDRQQEDMLGLLCRLTRGHRADPKRSLGGDSFDELVNASESSLEKAWLEYVRENGYRLPDRGQPHLEAHNTRPDFMYSESQTVVYIDGPHHDGQRRKDIDESITKNLQGAGYTVVRFTVDKNSWNRIFQEYAWVFGASVAPTEEQGE